jgi:transcription initiation factor TFIID subunit 10
MASDAPEKTEQTPPAPEVPSDEAPPAPTIPDSRLPTRKDVSLREFLNKMDDYAPIVRSSPLSIEPSNTF